MISERLKTIASLVKPKSVVADVGSDHALLPCYLVLENIVSKAYAIDNKVGPLESAKQNIKNHNLEDSVFTILQSGIIDLPDDVNSIIIAGMGYITISKILLDDIEHAKRVDQIIIQTNSALPLMRKFLNENGFVIDDEKFIIESKIEYNFISTHFENEVPEIDIYISQPLLEQRDFHYIKSLRNRLSELDKYIQFNDSYLEEYESIKNALESIA